MSELDCKNVRRYKFDSNHKDKRFSHNLQNVAIKATLSYLTIIQLLNTGVSMINNVYHRKVIVILNLS